MNNYQQQYINTFSPNQGFNHNQLYTHSGQKIQQPGFVQNVPQDQYLIQQVNPSQQRIPQSIMNYQNSRTRNFSPINLITEAQQPQQYIYQNNRQPNLYQNNRQSSQNIQQNRQSSPNIQNNLRQNMNIQQSNNKISNNFLNYNNQQLSINKPPDGRSNNSLSPSPNNQFKKGNSRTVTENQAFYDTNQTLYNQPSNQIIYNQNNQPLSQLQLSQISQMNLKNSLKGPMVKTHTSIQDIQVAEIVVEEKPLIEYVDNKIEVPKDILVEKIYERETYYDQEIQVPVEKIRENIIVQPIEHIIEKQVEKVVNVPEIVFQDRIREVKVNKPYKRVQEVSVDKVVEKPIEKIVDVVRPNIIERVVTKQVKVPQTIYNPVIKEVPRIKYVDKIVYQDNVQYVDEVEEVIEYEDKVVENVIEKYVEVPVEVQVITEKIQEKPVTRQYQTVVEEYVPVEFQQKKYQLKPEFQNLEGYQNVDNITTSYSKHQPQVQQQYTTDYNNSRKYEFQKVPSQQILQSQNKSPFRNEVTQQQQYKQQQRQNNRDASPYTNEFTLNTYNQQKQQLYNHYYDKSPRQSPNTQLNKQQSDMTFLQNSQNRPQTPNRLTQKDIYNQQRQNQQYHNTQQFQNY